MRLAMVFMMVPVIAVAQDWQPLTGAAISSALASREVVYADGTHQSFAADGATFYGDTTGHWRVEADQYCSQWPPSDRWSCYGVELSGVDLRFIAADGTFSVGRYVDLQ